MNQVIVAGGPSLVRTALTQVIDASGTLRVAHTPADAGELRGLLDAGLDADVVVLDRSLHTGEPDGFTALVHDTGAEARVVVFGVASVQDIDAQVRAGATGVLGADVSASQFVAALETVCRGGLVVALDTAPAVRKAPARVTPALTGRLSLREREILTMLSSGQDSASIARDLGLSPLTVKTHITHMLGKLGIRQRGQLVAFAYESGLIVPGTTPTGFLADRLRAAS